MNPCNVRARLARLQRECDVSVAPVLLLCAACAILVLMMALSAVTDETTPAQTAEPAKQTTPPAT